MKKKSPQGSNLSSNLKSGTSNVEEVETLGGRIRFIWILSGLKRDEISERLGVTSVTLTNYVKNKRLPNSEFLTRICTEFNVSPSWLLLFREPMFLEQNPEYPELSPAVGSAEQALTHPINKDCARCERLEVENQELVQENRELNKESRQLLKENGDMRVELAEIRARSGQSDESSRKAS